MPRLCGLRRLSAALDSEALASLWWAPLVGQEFTSCPHPRACLAPPGARYPSANNRLSSISTAP